MREEERTFDIVGGNARAMSRVKDACLAIRIASFYM